MKLNDEFVKDLQSLGTVYDETKYFNFFRKHGTHYREGVKIGGLISLESYTTSSYYNSSSL